MDINAYFEQADTPSKNSPVGVLMVKVLAKFLEMTRDRRGTRESLNFGRAVTSSCTSRRH
jgi:hypothetical protein